MCSVLHVSKWVVSGHLGGLDRDGLSCSDMLTSSYSFLTLEPPNTVNGDRNQSGERE